MNAPGSPQVADSGSAPGPRPWWAPRFLAVFDVFALATILNFIVFLGVAVHLGGEAMGGKVEGDRYYLCLVRSRGTPRLYTEVTRAEFIYSRWHQGSVLLTWPLMMAGALVRSRLRGRGQNAATPEG